MEKAILGFVLGFIIGAASLVVFISVGEGLASDACAAHCGPDQGRWDPAADTCLCTNTVEATDGSVVSTTYPLVCGGASGAGKD